MTTPDKRKFRRVSLSGTVEVEAGGKTHRCEARNISVGGMLLRAGETLGEGQRLRLSFRLPGAAQTITATGTVQHVSPGAFMGVQFDALTPAVLAVIEQYVLETPSLRP